jgi:hypothetical protein
MSLGVYAVEHTAKNEGHVGEPHAGIFHAISLPCSYKINTANAFAVFFSVTHGKE